MDLNAEVKKLRVLMIGPGLDVTGGVSAVVNNWLDAGLGDRIELEYIATITESRAGLYPGKIVDGLMALVSFSRQIVRHYDVVHIHLSYGASFYRKLIFFLVARAARKKILVHLHGSKFEEFYFGSIGIFKHLISFMFNRADCVLVLSKQWEKFVQEIAPGARTKILFNGAFPRDYRAKVATGGEIITFMGRLGERKGTYDLIEAFSRVYMHCKTAKLILCGDGDLERVKKIVRQKGLDSAVDIPGWVSGDAKQEIYLQSELFVLPSYNEGLPGAILEAMSYGLPIVSTRVGGIPEAVEEGVNGLLIEAGDVDGMVNAIEKLLENPGKRSAMADESRRLIKTKFNIYVLVEELLNSYSMLKRTGLIPP